MTRFLGDDGDDGDDGDGDEAHVTVRASTSPRGLTRTNFLPWPKTLMDGAPLWLIDEYCIRGFIPPELLAQFLPFECTEPSQLFPL